MPQVLGDDLNWAAVHHDVHLFARVHALRLGSFDGCHQLADFRNAGHNAKGYRTCVWYLLKPAPDEAPHAPLPLPQRGAHELAVHKQPPVALPHAAAASSAARAPIAAKSPPVGKAAAAAKAAPIVPPKAGAGRVHGVPIGVGAASPGARAGSARPPAKGVGGKVAAG